MSLDAETDLEDGEIDAFLSRSETGVLSLGRDDEPYSVPISNGYDATASRFYLRLVSTPESEKRRFLESNPIARLVVLEGDGDIYRSVIASHPRIDSPEGTLGRSRRPVRRGQAAVVRGVEGIQEGH